MSAIDSTMEALIETKIEEVILPNPTIFQRKFDELDEIQGRAAGLHPVLARVIAARPKPVGFSFEQILTPKLSQLLSPESMADMEMASARVVKAILNKECIGIETDHDCDGQTSHAVLYYNVVHRFGHPTHLIRSYIGHRLEEGYGLSLSVAKRILADTAKPSLIITADNGSSDEERICLLKENNIDVIVTDHHEIPKEGFPKSAYACLNPTREDCQYADPYIAGCMVAWLLMASVRQKLIDAGYLPKDAPSLADSLDFVAVGTVADCVSLARSQNNRAVVNFGMRLIEAGSRPCWRAIKQGLTQPIRSHELGFRIGPILNSDGRLSSAFGSVTFLLAESDEEALDWIQVLQKQNEERKGIQRKIVEKGLKIAEKEVKKGRKSLCLFLPEGHSGVQGIAASRIKDVFGRPTAIFAPKFIAKVKKHLETTQNEDLMMGNEDLITGSVRGILDFHVRQALQQVSEWIPSILISFGGHQGAGGLTLKLRDFEKFSELFEKATEQQLGKEAKLGPIILTDGSLKREEINLKMLDEILRLEPFGREFEVPIFEMEAFIKEIRTIGDGTHAKLILESEGNSYNAIWFGLRQTAESKIPIEKETHVKVVFSLKDNFYRGNRYFDLQVLHLQPKSA